MTQRTLILFENTDEIKRQLQSSEVKVVITIPLFLPAVLEAQKTAPSLRQVIVLGEAQNGCHTFSEMIKTDTTGVQFHTGKEIDVRNDVASLPYSSGTTGKEIGTF
jgi:acyl-coenzyme A synthetase/AMP-(fatty) acid ligase